MAIFSFDISTSRRVTSTRGPPGSTAAGLASAADAGASSEALRNAAAARRLRKAFAFVISSSSQAYSTPGEQAGSPAPRTFVEITDRRCRHEQDATRGVQRWRDRDSHHDHGAGA